MKEQNKTRANEMLSHGITCAVGTVEQTEQPNYLAEGQTPL